jgi:putative ABC transport system permease protein
MLLPGDIVTQSIDALKAHKMRAALTTLGLMMGVTTLITVMTIVEGANSYVEEKIANLGTNVFQIAKTPFATTDFNMILKALKYRRIDYSDLEYLAENCRLCAEVGGSATTTMRGRRGDKEVMDVNIIGQTSNMADIDTRTIELGRFFTPTEESRSATVCLIGENLRKEFFEGMNPIGKSIRFGNADYTIVGVYQPIGAVLGQNQDNFAVIPMTNYLRLRGSTTSLTLNIRAVASGEFDAAMDEARALMRARRHVFPGRDEDFFIGTKESYISLWQSISGAFFAVFVMVSAISGVVGGIVIMNVMLVSVTERTKEIGIRRAVGATEADIRRQFLTESVMQCLVGGVFGIGAGFLFALMLRQFTSFPAVVQTWVAILGLTLSSAIGLFFGIYPAVRASRLDPVEALRAE